MGGTEQGIEKRSKTAARYTFKETRKFWTPQRGWTNGFLHSPVP